jgi:hypothetical protein
MVQHPLSADRLPLPDLLLGAAEKRLVQKATGFCGQVFRELPMEFAVETQKLLGVSLEGSVG